MLEEFWLTQSDGQDIYIRKWKAQKQIPLAIVQLAHGMAEHSGRYHEFAKFLVSHGFIVYANDHRGHGRTGEKMGTMGFLADKDGFERAVEDLKTINDQIHHTYPNLPVFMLGHSMGSFLVRRLIQRYSNAVDGVILSGTGAGKGLIGKLGRIMAKFEIKRLGAKSESPLMDKLSFGQFNKKFKDSESWISSDPETVQIYQDDPYCGFISTAKFFEDLLSGIELIHKRTEIARIDQSLPFLLISGTADPVGNNGKGVKQVVKIYKRAGIQSIDLILYPNGRHEMLFETNRDQVMKDILSWLIKMIA
ncbi:alpha/beta hydrolase [Amphibacillus sp. Q70]|uniref:alpha/beta hydrolase n=1 Tax=Amphibacillus sp. Q70 TaxID=3453416 RepID=UPI003F85907E